VAAAFVEVSTSPVCGADELCIWGGACDEDDLKSLINVWQAHYPTGMPWRFYEYVSTFSVNKASPELPAYPHSYANLERARLFGPTGDLDARRDGKRFLWRFIGSRGANSQEEEALKVLTALDGRSFWEEYPDKTFREIETHTLQWRAQEQQVKGDWLNYAGLNAARVRLNQKQYLDAGHIAFVWFTGLEEDK
jgi:hypothetical protein